MAHTKKKDPLTGTIKQPLGPVVVSGTLFFGIFAFMAFFLPYYSYFYFSIALTIGAIGIIGLIWLNIKPNLWAKTLYYVSLSSLCTIIAVRAFNYLLPNLKTILGLAIVLSVIFSHSLPLWNTELTRLLRGELSFAPKTRPGKFMLRISLSILPVAGFIGAAIGLFLRGGDNKIAIPVLILGPLCWFLAVILPFSTKHPISPWEYKQQRKLERD